MRKSVMVLFGAIGKTKESIVKRFCIVCLVVLMTLCLSRIASAAPVLHLEPAVANLMPCESVDIGFWLDTGLVEGTDSGLTSMGLLIEFDQTIAGVTAIVVPMGAGGWMGGGNWDNSTGEATMGGMMWMDPFPPNNTYPLFGDVLLGTVTFHILDTALLGNVCALITADANPAPFDDFVLEDGTVWDDVIEYGTGSLHVVPIPGTILLLGSGFVGLVCLRRKLVT